MKSVRASARASSCFSHQIRSRGILQRYRPNQSPTLKTTKWSELNKSGCIDGLTGTIDIVMAGKIDCIAYHIRHVVNLNDEAGQLTRVVMKT